MKGASSNDALSRANCIFGAEVRTIIEHGITDNRTYTMHVYYHGGTISYVLDNESHNTL